MDWLQAAKMAGVRVGRGSDGWIPVFCPWHEDRHPSASLCLDNGVLWCHRCDRGSRVDKLDSAPDFLGRVQVDPAPREEQSLRPAGSVDNAEAVYYYRNANGLTLFRVVRRRLPGGGKRFEQQPYKDGLGWVTGRGAMKDVPRVLYRLPELLANSGTVILVEGEKVVGRLVQFGFRTATTSPGGSSGWRDEYAESLAGRRVVILPDNDVPGMSYAHRAFKSLLLAGASPSIVQLPDLPPGGDAYDWLEDHSAEDLCRRCGIPETELWP